MIVTVGRPRSNGGYAQGKHLYNLHMKYSGWLLHELGTASCK